MATTTPPSAGPHVRPAQNELPPRGLPIFTVLMLAAIIGIHAYVASLPSRRLEEIYLEYALIPGRFTELQDYSLAALATFLTHALLHGGWAHVLANAYALFLFGMLAERFLGTARVVLVYVASAIAGGLFFMLLDPDAYVPLVGASGAISGLFGAAILSAPERSRKALINNAVVWLALNVGLPALAASSFGPRIAWEAHLGGFLVGLVLGWVLRQSMPRVAPAPTTVTTSATRGAPATTTGSTAGSAASSAASRAGAKKPEPFNPVQRRR